MAARREQDLEHLLRPDSAEVARAEPALAVLDRERAEEPDHRPRTAGVVVEAPARRVSTHELTPVLPPVVTARLRRGSGPTQRRALAWPSDNHQARIRHRRTKGDAHEDLFEAAAARGRRAHAIAAAAAMGSQALAGSKDGTASAKGLGPLSGLLPRDHLTEESAIQVDLSKESVRLPLYKGKAQRRDRLVRPARRLRPGDRARPGRQLRAQARQPRHRRPGGRADGDARVADAGPEQVRAGGRRLPGRAGLQPDPDRRARARPASRWRSSSRAPSPAPGYSPFIRIAGSPTVYSAPIVATGDGPFDVVHHTNTGDRVLGIHIAGPSAPGPVRGVVGRPAVREGLRRRPADRLHLDRRRPAADRGARALDLRAGARQALPTTAATTSSAPPASGCSASSTARPAPDNKESQGFVHLVKDGHASEDASAGNTALIDALRNGGDLLNVFGDFPTEKDPRHAQSLQPALGRPARPLDRQGRPAGPEQAPDRRGAGLQPRRHPARPAHRRRPGDRPARSVRLGRRRHQLRRDRVHRQGPDGQPRRPRPELAVPAPLDRRTGRRAELRPAVSPVRAKEIP